MDPQTKSTWADGKFTAGLSPIASRQKGSSRAHAETRAVASVPLIEKTIPNCGNTQSITSRRTLFPTRELKIIHLVYSLIKQMNKAILVALISLTLILAVNAQSGYFNIAKVRKERYFSFPVLTGRSNLRSQKKINQFLQLSELRSLSDKEYKHMFDAAATDDGSIYGGKTDMSYLVYQNSSRVFSVGFDNASSGATSHYWVSYYNFNSQNGDRIALHDLFSDQGYKAFVQSVTKIRIRKYRSEVMKKVRAEDREAYLGVIDLIKADDFADFTIGTNSLSIDGDNLLNKNLKFDGIDMEVKFSIASFGRYLSEFGKTIFGLKTGKVVGFRSNSLPQLFAGTVNGVSPFVGVMFYDGLSGTEGIYAYLKYRTGIYLTGNLENQKLDLTEHVLTQTELNMRTDSNHRYEDGGTISGTFDGTRLDGTWTNKAKTRTIPITAKRE
jgi:hypothetical protein